MILLCLGRYIARRSQLWTSLDCVPKPGLMTTTMTVTAPLKPTAAAAPTMALFLSSPGSSARHWDREGGLHKNHTLTG